MRITLRLLLLILTGIAVMIVIVGRQTRSGSVIVSQRNLPRIESILADHNVRSWQANSSLGAVHVSFPNPFSLTAVDDAIVGDARRNGYCVELRYNAMIPYFSSERKINAEIGLFGKP